MPPLQAAYLLAFLRITTNVTIVYPINYGGYFSCAGRDLWPMKWCIHGAMRAFSNRPLRRFGKPVRLERAGADLRDADGYPVDGATVEMDAVADIQPVRDMAEWNLPDGARPNDVRKLLINLPVKARDEASEADEVVEGTGHEVACDRGKALG